MSAPAEAARVPGTAQSWLHQREIHSKALIVNATVRQGESPTRAVQRHVCVLRSAEPGPTPSEGCGREPMTLSAGEAFPLRLGPPSGAAKGHWLCLLKEACGEMEQPWGQVKILHQELVAALVGGRLCNQATNQRVTHSYCARGNGGWGSVEGIRLSLLFMVWGRGRGD